MFEYNVCDQADIQLFRDQCRALEKRFPEMKVHDLLDDVDGTMIQRYTHDRGIITVKNDLQVDAIYVVSEFDLLPYFTKE